MAPGALLTEARTADAARARRPQRRVRGPRRVHAPPDAGRARARHDGWPDDDIAFVWPWGFELAAIRVPVLHWHGVQDRFVPVGHVHWLAANISGVESRITPGDGHLTLFERRVPEVHAWLLERATLSADGNP